MAQIFISYRRSDTQANTDRIYVELVKAFGRKSIFKDVDDIPPGVDFPNYLQGKIQDAKIVLIIIGKQWATVAYEDGSFRLHDPEDFVRIEVELALSMGNALVIPVLVNNASMPSPNQLPTSIRSITRLNAMQVRNDPDFENDSRRLVRKLKERGLGKLANTMPLVGVVLAVIITIAGIFASNLFNQANTASTPTNEGTTEVAMVATTIVPAASNNVEETATLTGFQLVQTAEAGITQAYETQVAYNETVTQDVAISINATATAQQFGFTETAAYATLFALSATPTASSSPTITPTPTDTPISSSDIQNTAMAETFSAATNAVLTQTLIAQATQNVVGTQLFTAGETATDIFQLSLTPFVTDTLEPSPTIRPTNTYIPTNSPTLRPSNTPSPNSTLDPLHEALHLASTPMSSNAEWQNLYPDGFVWEFDGVPMVLVPTGCFQMGNDQDAWDGGTQGVKDGGEQCFDEAFWIDQTEVTQADFARLEGTKATANYFSGENLPVEQITWLEARDFCEQERGGRLPTEGEWEYAARGPAALLFPWGNEWIINNSVWSFNQTVNVGSRPLGASWVGAFDLSGNVWEWTRSVYQDYPYDALDGREDDRGNRIDILYTVRGGSWNVNDANVVRSSTRSWWDPSVRSNRYLGFRCVRSYNSNGS